MQTSMDNIKGKALKTRYKTRAKKGLSLGSVGAVSLGKAPRSGPSGVGTGRGVDAPRPTGPKRHYQRKK